LNQALFSKKKHSG